MGGQLEPIRGPHNSLRNHPRATFVYTYIEGAEGGYLIKLETPSFKNICFFFPFTLNASNIFEQFANNILVTVYIYFTTGYHLGG